MARTGKIARLPRATRTELNRRLDDGQSAGTILNWVNNLPASEKGEAADEASINEVNLTAWRQGGYQEWVQMEAFFDRLALMPENYQEAVDLTGEEGVTSLFTTMMILQVGKMMADRLGDPMDTPQARAEMLRMINKMTSLRRIEMATLKERQERAPKDNLSQIKATTEYLRAFNNETRSKAETAHISQTSPTLSKALTEPPNKGKFSLFTAADLYPADTATFTSPTQKPKQPLKAAKFGRVRLGG